MNCFLSVHSCSKRQHPLIKSPDCTPVGLSHWKVIPNKSLDFLSCVFCRKIIGADNFGGRGSGAVDSFDSRDAELEESSIQENRIPRARPSEGRFPTPRRSSQMEGGRRGRGLWEDRMEQG